MNTTFFKNNALELTALFFLVAASLYIYFVVRGLAPFRVCTPVDFKEYEQFQKTITALDAIADLAIKLATTLVALAAAILAGLKKDVRLSPISRLFVLIAALCFAQSALYAVWWRMGVAELWLNECLQLISAPRLTSRFDAQFYFFMAGLAALSLLVLGALLSSKSEIPKDEV